MPPAMRDLGLGNVEALRIAWGQGFSMDKASGDQDVARLHVAPATRPLRILTCLHSFDLGGVERVALRLCEAWTTAGVETRVALGRDLGKMRPTAPKLNYDVAPTTRFSTEALETPWMIWWLWRAIRRDRPDLLFGAGNIYAVVMVAMKLLLGRKCPPVVLKISNDLARPDKAPITLFLYRCWCRIQGHYLDHFVAMAKPMRAQIASSMVIDDGRISVVPDPALSAADLKTFALAGDASRASRGAGRRFIAIGRLAPQKNFAALVEAFRAGAHPSDWLVIVGEGPDRPALQAQIERLGLGKRVTLAGYSGDPAAWFARADILVLSSIYEGLPAAVIEALAAGLPVIATDCSPAMSWLLNGGALGRLVPLGEPNMLAWAIAATEPGSTSRSRARAKAARFTVENAATAYEALFRNLARR